jgi:pimeloyl-ACP methyl ester carboxylesterase
MDRPIPRPAGRSGLRLGPQPRTVDLDGPVSWVDHGGPDDGQLVVAVHGLGGSHANWHDLAPLLTHGHRVVAVDLAGHGRTPRAGRSASMVANCALLGRFLDHVDGRPAVLLGNSMGGALSLLHAAARPESVAGLALIGPALPRTALPGRALARQVALFAVPGMAERSLGRRRARLGAEAFVEATLQLTCADPSMVSAEVRELAVQVACDRSLDRDADAAFLEAARSLAVLVTRAARYRALIASVRVPGIVLQGREDRLVPAGGTSLLAELQPGWPVHLLDGVGHVPQIEAPQRTAELLLPFLDGLQPAAAPAGSSSSDLLAGAS